MSGAATQPYEDPILLSAALDYARRGWPVLPLHGITRARRCTCGAAPGRCSAGKHPRSEHGLKDASADPAVIRSWWARWPDSNIGIVTGTPSGIAVIDVDGSEGMAALLSLAGANGEIPQTPRCRTGRGFHLYFHGNRERLKSRAAIGGRVGLDSRADGGYAVAPPSRHESGSTYTWETAPDEIQMQPVPEWLRDLLRVQENSNGHSVRMDTAAVLAGVPEGVRDTTLFKLACKLRRAEVPEAMAESLVLEAASRCEPPFPAEAAREKVSRAYRYAPAEHPTAETPYSWGPPIEFTRSSAPPFPSEALPPCLRDYVIAVAEATQTPIDLGGGLALAAIATACAGRIVIVVRPGWKEASTIYMVVALPSGCRKSAVFEEFTAPIREIEEREAVNARPEITRRRTEREILAARFEKVKRAAAEDPSRHGEALGIAEELAECSVPPSPRRLVDDTTPEALASLLCAHKRIAALAPEGDLFDVLAGRYAKKGDTPNVGVVLRAYSGEAVRVDRVSRDGEFVSHPGLVIGLTVQPGHLAGLAASPMLRHRGLLARFCYSIPGNPLGSRSTDPAPVPEDVRDDYHRKIKSIFTALSTMGETEPEDLGMTPEARAVIVSYMAELEPELADLGRYAGVRDLAGKSAGLAARLAGLLHIAEHPVTTPIRKEAAGRGVELARYYLQHGIAAFALMGAHRDMEDAKYLVSVLRKLASSTVTKRGLFNAARGRFKTVPQMEGALGLLMEHGFLREMERPDRPGPGRRASPTYEVNPALNSADSA